MLSFIGDIPSESVLKCLERENVDDGVRLEVLRDSVGRGNWIVARIVARSRIVREVGELSRTDHCHDVGLCWHRCGLRQPGLGVEKVGDVILGHVLTFRLPKCGS